MSQRCCGVWPSGERCRHLGAVVDEARGGWVCYVHAPPGPIQQEAVRIALRRAMLHPERYLAAALAEWTDEVLAEELGCAPAVLWRLRLMGWPRADQWVPDVQLMADALGADTSALAALLRALSRMA
jgi:hypothetical protein